jgi:hypothetical protein
MEHPWYEIPTSVGFNLFAAAFDFLQGDQVKHLEAALNADRVNSSLWGSFSRWLRNGPKTYPGAEISAYLNKALKTATRDHSFQIHTAVYCDDRLFMS